jgi:hypothetical protein
MREAPIGKRQNRYSRERSSRPARVYEFMSYFSGMEDFT